MYFLEPVSYCMFVLSRNRLLFLRTSQVNKATLSCATCESSLSSAYACIECQNLGDSVPRTICKQDKASFILKKIRPLVHKRAFHKQFWLSYVFVSSKGNSPWWLADWKPTVSVNKQIQKWIRSVPSLPACQASQCLENRSFYEIHQKAQCYK